MPVFAEYSTASRGLRVLPSFAPEGEDEKYEVVISGVGPPKRNLTNT